VDPHESASARIRIRTKVMRWIRIRISLEMTSHNVGVCDMSLLDHFFKVLSLYLEARIRIRIRIKVKSRVRIRIRIKVTNRILIRGSASLRTDTGTYVLKVIRNL
jgi:hypothetical protein